MTEQEKQLLLKDLCARLPYGVMVNFKYGIKPLELRDISFDGSVWLGNDKFSDDIEDIKPYLRPMSDLTFQEFKKIYLNGDVLYNTDDKIVISTSWKTVDYMNERMIDYRDLIGKGLALKAPEGMYKTKTE